METIERRCDIGMEHRTVTNVGWNRSQEGSFSVSDEYKCSTETFERQNAEHQRFYETIEGKDGYHIGCRIERMGR